VTQERVESRAPMHWQAPVWEPVRTPGEALEKLANRGSIEQGRHYRSARANCLAALHHALDPELAREGFIHASIKTETLHGAG
jgi:hypothetical protein